MNFLILGFLTSMSLILAIGAQNIFVIEQGLKKKNIFFICLICSISDLLLIFLGIFLFHVFIQYFNSTVELTFNVLLIVFLLHFIYTKVAIFNKNINFTSKDSKSSKYNILLKTLGFTYLNPHVYSDTVFILGNFSKNFLLDEKIMFGIGASIASFLFFFILGYLSKLLSSYVQNKKIWNIINISILIYMSLLTIYIFVDTVSN
ncbi:LysE/ArgO family amino acid transporter [Candidatus Pelagibacter sp. Uisw_127]|uniref:LysE/ArgO family amino acid transporter n=1 Tax=Candidatus Pelagibacter sp. Uisw_127 TaxID=3230988 RepID=UPI0039EAD18F